MKLGSFVCYSIKLKDGGKIVVLVQFGFYFSMQ